MTVLSGSESPATALPGLALLADEFGSATAGRLVLVVTRPYLDVAAQVSGFADDNGIEVSRLAFDRWDPRLFRRRFRGLSPATSVTGVQRVLLLADFVAAEHDFADVLAPGTAIQMASWGTPFSPLRDLEPDAVLRARADRLADALDTDLVRATGGDGTMLRLRRDPSRGWSTEPSSPTARFVRVLPAGLLRGGVHDADGVFRADGVLGVNRLWNGDVRLASAPVVIRVRNGRVTEMDCRDATILGFLRRAVFTFGVDQVGFCGLGLSSTVDHYSATNRAAVNVCRAGVTVTLTAPADRRSLAGDLRIDLTSPSTSLGPA